MASELVLVSGGSGFVGVHCVLQLLQKGYHVRTTIRSSKRENDVREMLKAGGATNLENLQFAVADLGKDDGWVEAAKGCKYVLHVASPLPPAPPKHENDLIIPAREGTLRILRAARDAGVTRCVMTSSFAAIGYPRDLPEGKVFTEEDWTDPQNPSLSAYNKSKTIAERAAWDFVAKEGGSLEFATVNPVLILGPVLAKDYSSSVILAERLMNGSLPGCPQINFGLVDVRDVADLHIRAMTNPEAKGERFQCVSGKFMSVQSMGAVLRERFGKSASKVPKRNLPNILLRLSALWDKEVALILPELGKVKEASNAKAKEKLGWNPRPPEEAVIAAVESLMKVGVLKDTN